MVEQAKYQTQGAKFKALREEAGLSQLEVANCLGVDTNYIAELENGTRLLSDFSLIDKAKYLFLCEAQELFSDGPTKKYCSISFRSAPLLGNSLEQLINVQSIVSTQFFMDELEKTVPPRLEVPACEEPFWFYYNQANNFSNNEQRESNKQSINANTNHKALPKLDFTITNQDLSKETIDYCQIQEMAYKLREYLGVSKTEPIDIFKVCLDQIPNLTIVFSDLEQRISGICYKGEKSHVIVINQSMTLGRQRFSMAHELFHLFFDASNKKSVSSDMNKQDVIERMADAFASYFLLPEAALNQFLETHKWQDQDVDKLELILKLEQEFQISHQATLNRLSSILDVTTIPNTNITNLASQYNFPLDIYQDKKHELTTNGYYLKQLNHLYDARIIHAKRVHKFLELSQNFDSEKLEELKQHYDRY